MLKRYQALGLFGMAGQQSSFRWLWLPTVTWNDTIQQTGNRLFHIKILTGVTNHLYESIINERGKEFMVFYTTLGVSVQDPQQCWKLSPSFGLNIWNQSICQMVQVPLSSGRTDMTSMPVNFLQEKDAKELLTMMRHQTQELRLMTISAPSVNTKLLPT